MYCLWSIAAHGSSIDIDTNSLSIFNVVEEIHLPGAPPNPDSVIWISFPMVLLCGWKRTNPSDEGYLRVELHSAAGERLFGSPGAGVQLTFGQSKQSRTRVNVPAFPIKGEGEYNFRILLSSSETGPFEEVAHVPIEVSYTPLTREQVQAAPRSYADVNIQFAGEEGH